MNYNNNEYNNTNESFIVLSTPKLSSSSYTSLDRQLDINNITGKNITPYQNTFQLNDDNYGEYTMAYTLAPPIENQESYSSWKQNNKKKEEKINLQWSQEISYKMSFLDNKYYFQTPYKKFYELLNEFGKPNLLDPSSGGMAIWYNTKLKGLYYRDRKSTRLNSSH